MSGKRPRGDGEVEAGLAGERIYRTAYSAPSMARPANNNRPPARRPPPSAPAVPNSSRNPRRRKCSSANCAIAAQIAGKTPRKSSAQRGTSRLIRSLHAVVSSSTNGTTPNE